MTTTPTLQHLTRPFDDAHIPVVVTQPFAHLAPGLEPLCWFYGAGLYGFHWTPGAVENSYHLGVDYALAQGTDLLASAAGVVISAGWDSSGFGMLTILDHGRGLLTFYAHQSAQTVAAGQIVHAGQAIGKVGSTGNSTGPHLHWATATPDGMGYYFFFDPQPYLDYAPPPPVPHPAPAPTAGAYVARVDMYMRMEPRLDAPHGPLVKAGQRVTADAGWTTNFRRVKDTAGHEGWLFAPNLLGAP